MLQTVTEFLSETKFHPKNIKLYLSSTGGLWLHNLLYKVSLAGAIVLPASTNLARTNTTIIHPRTAALFSGRSEI
jgi:hypothetical protein